MVVATPDEERKAFIAILVHGQIVVEITVLINLFGDCVCTSLDLRAKVSQGAN